MARTACNCRDLESTNGTIVNGEHVEGVGPVNEGDVIQVGASTLTIRKVFPADAAMSADGRGQVAFNRPMRIRRPLKPQRIQLPTRPSDDRHAGGFPLVAVVSPAILGVVSAVAFGRPQMLIIAGVSPLMALANVVSQRRARARDRSGDMAAYRRDHGVATQRASQAQRSLAAERRLAWPDPAAVVAFATAPHRRLWERRPDDSDALDLRIGLADLPVGVELVSSGASETGEPKAPAVPAVVSLRAAGVVGVAGPRAAAMALTRWLVAQLAVLHSPRNLTLVLLCPDDAERDWAWFWWLPHATPDAGTASLIGNSPRTREARVKELVKLIDDREEELRGSGERRGFESEVVLIIDGARATRTVPGLPKILRAGPAVGVYAVCVDLESAYLPEEGRAQVVLAANGLTAEVAVTGEDPIEDVAADQLSVELLTGVARALAPIRDVSGEGVDLLPASVRFVDVVDIDLDDPDGIVARWTIGGHSTKTCVGVDANGAFELDIDFKADGPHSLVVGTTGAGKSEFLRTFIAGLLITNRPDALNLVLIDFKGGGAFAAFEDAPHTVGFVTNLDVGETRRALVSLDAELERRQRELRDLAADNLEAAWAMDPTATASRGLPRLVIVIDELAELVDELPDFVPGLIRIARVGRSLGVHLVLATQRPSAKTVTPEMRTNTSLRVALRLNDKADSTDVIDAPDAWMIPKSRVGRGFVRTEQKGLVQFQTALSSGPRRGDLTAVPAPTVYPIAWPTVGESAAVLTKGADDPRATDLHALVAVVGKATARLAIAKSPSPWLPPLPGVTVIDVEPSKVDGGDQPNLAPVAIGLEDLPDQQCQRPATWNLESAGHIAIGGSPRTGRTTALRTMIGALCVRHSPSDVHVYGLDFGNGALLAMRDLPHSGAIVLRTEPERVERLIARLTDEVRRRQEILATAGVADVAEQRRRARPSERLPYLVVALDRWDTFLADFASESQQQVRDDLQRLVREGLSAGVRFLISGDLGLLVHKVAQQIDTELVLRLADRQDYRTVGLDPRGIADDLPPGRGHWANSSIELQVGLLSPNPSGEAQGLALRKIAEGAEQHWPASARTSSPMRIDVLPSTVGFDLAWPSAAAPLSFVVGVGGDELSPIRVDLASDGPGYVIGGGPRSGRSLALCCFAASAVQSGVKVVAVTPRPSPLAAWASRGVIIFGGPEPDLDELRAALEATTEPLLVLVDDADLLARKPADEIIETALARPGLSAVAIAGKIDELAAETRGFIPKTKRSKYGILLSPNSTLQGDLVGLRLQRSQLGKFPPGRGILSLGGEPFVVQIPLVTP